MSVDATSPASFASRLCEATNSHDVERVVACFAPGYLNETPTHLARAFVGRDQVRRNWSQFFAAVPDLHAELLRSCQDGNTVWTEWEMRGHRVGGAEHQMRGVNIFTIDDAGLAAAIRFYLEPVDTSDTTADQAVRLAMQGPPP